MTCHTNDSARSEKARARMGTELGARRNSAVRTITATMFPLLPMLRAWPSACVARHSAPHRHHHQRVPPLSRSRSRSSVGGDLLFDLLPVLAAEPRRSTTEAGEDVVAVGGRVIVSTKRTLKRAKVVMVLQCCDWRIFSCSSSQLTYLLAAVVLFNVLGCRLTY